MSWGLINKVGVVGWSGLIIVDYNVKGIGMPELSDFREAGIGRVMIYSHRGRLLENIGLAY